LIISNYLINSRRIKAKIEGAATQMLTDTITSRLLINYLSNFLGSLHRDKFRFFGESQRNQKTGGKFSAERRQARRDPVRAAPG
jgi:hypothetical protein